MAENFVKARALRDELYGIVKANYKSDIRFRTVSIRLLEYYCTYLNGFINVLEGLSVGNTEATAAAMNEFKMIAGRIEAYIENYFDRGQAIGIIDYRIMRLFNV